MENESASLVIENFVEEGKLSLSNALEISMLLVDVENPGGKIDVTYFINAKANARAPYERAANALPEISREREMLKDAHAYLISIFEDFSPYSSEQIDQYERRISERIFQFRVLANRLSLGR